ncbi:MAG: hypothetical protein KDD35_04665, partial [Bdellovibrionales bacterium]|nr:hypothetical protein [Bdellovibrionales bacterium]
DGGEGQLAMAKGFRGRKLYYAAFELLVRMAKERIGSSIGEAALYELSLLTQESAFDHEELNRLLIGNEFPRLHPDIDSFVSYYQAMDLLQLGFSDWAKVPLGRIRKGSYWDFLMQYWTAVGEVARGRIDRAIALFQGLTEEPGLPQPLFEKAALQYSRLVFEKGDFQTAFVIYNNLKIKGVREFGRIQLERAWVYYYLKDFGKAMGILTALQAPYFKPSLTFERHILEMIIYRDLCHYEAVEYVAQRFRENFKDSLIAIRNRQALRDDRVLFNLSVMNREVQEDANLIDQIRREGNLLKDYPWEGFSFYNPLLEGYARIDEILQARVGNQLEEKARAAANELLDAEEQVQFLEYTSRLDRLRIRRGTELKYLSQEISLVTFEKIFWPVDSEFWWDEIPDYNMNISSRCGDSGLSEENDLEKDFE